MPADAAAINALGLGTSILADIHGPAVGGVTKAEQVFAEQATSTWGAMVRGGGRCVFLQHSCVAAPILVVGTAG